MILSDWGNGTGWDRKENDATACAAMCECSRSWCAYLLYAWIRFAPFVAPAEINMEREKFKGNFEFAKVVWCECKSIVCVHGLLFQNFKKYSHTHIHICTLSRTKIF